MSKGSNEKTLTTQEPMPPERLQNPHLADLDYSDLDLIEFDPFLDNTIGSLAPLEKNSSDSETHALALKKIAILEHRIKFYLEQNQPLNGMQAFDDELDLINLQIQQENIKFSQALQNAIHRKEAELKKILDSSNDEYLSSDESTAIDVLPPQASPLRDFPRDELLYLFSGEKENLKSHWQFTRKKDSGAVEPAEHTGFYENKDHPEYKVFIKQDTAHPENDYVEFLLSRIMRDIAEEIELDPQLIAQIELLYTHADDSKATISKEKNVYIASGVFTNYQDLWKDAYSAFLALDIYKQFRDEYFKAHSLTKLYLPKRRPHFFQNDEIINLMIKIGRYPSFQSIKELSRSMREVDTHFENIGVTTGKYTENNTAHLVVVHKTTREMIAVKDSHDAIKFPLKDYKHYYVFDNVDACRIDLGAGLGDERCTYREFEYSDNPFYNLYKLMPGAGGPPPHILQGPKELEVSSKRLVILSRIASLSKELLSEVFQAAALEANKYFGEEISRRVAIKKLGMKLDNVNNLGRDLIPQMGDFFGETFIENQAKPIKDIIQSKLNDLEKNSVEKNSVKDEIENNLKKVPNRLPFKHQINKWKRELSTLSEECQFHYDNVARSKSQDNELDSSFLKDITLLKLSIDEKISTLNKPLPTTKRHPVKVSDYKEIEEVIQKQDAICKDIEEFIQEPKNSISKLVDYYEIKKRELTNLKVCRDLIAQLPNNPYKNKLLNIVRLIDYDIRHHLEEKNNIGLLRALIQLSTSLTCFSSLSKTYDNERNDINKLTDLVFPLLENFVANNENYSESIVSTIDQLLKELFNYREAIKQNPRLNAKSDKLLAYQYEQISILLQAVLNKESNYEARVKTFTEHLQHATSLVTDLTTLKQNINHIETRLAQNNAIDLILDKPFTKLFNSGKQSYQEGCRLALHCLTNPKTSLNDLTLIANSIQTTNAIMTCATSNDVKKIEELPKHIKFLREKSIEQIKTKPTNWKKFAGIGLAIVGIAVTITSSLFFKFGITIPIAWGGVKLTIAGLSLAGIGSVAGMGLFATSRLQPITKNLLNVADYAHDIYKKRSSTPKEMEVSIREVPVKKP